MPNYIKVFYSENILPYTEYPLRLSTYLFNRFNMKKGDKFFDVGCGRGEFARGFKSLGLEVSGMDREKGNSEMLNGIDFKLGDIESNSFPFSDQKFDFVFSKSAIEHLQMPDNFIKEIYRILKPGGRIIVMTPDWQSQRRIFYDDYTHVHPYTKTGLRDLLKAHGFENIETEIFYQLPILWKYPWLKIFSKCLQIFGPPKRIYKNKFTRWSRELMILGTGIKTNKDNKYD